MFPQGAFRRIDDRVDLVANRNRFLALFVLGRMLFRILHHLFDLLIRKTAGRLNGDLLLSPGRTVLGANI